MKNTLLVLLLTAFGLQAQTNPATPNREEAMREALRRAVRGQTNAPVAPAPSAAEAIAAPAAAAVVPSVVPATPPPNIAPAPAIPAATVPAPAAPVVTAPRTIPVPIVPNPEEMIPTGMINWTAADLNQVLTIYAEMVGRTILRPAALASAPIMLKAQTPLTRAEAVQALDAVLALNNIAMVNVGDKFVKAVPVTQANQEGAPFNQLDVSQMPSLGSYVTHVVQLKYAKPSELVAVLQPFAKIPNSILPIDSSGILVLRDITENVKRMLEMIEKVDVTVQSEYASEVIPIKYAKAEDIASALNSVSSGGGGTTVGARPAGAAPGTARGGIGTQNPAGQPTQSNTLGQPGAGAPSSGASFTDRLQKIIQRASSTSSGDLQILGTTKIIADVRSNSLLIFAMRQDMAMIKDIINKLDVVLAQVLIETIIMDVTIGDTWALGVSARQRPKDFTPNITGAGGYNNSQQFFNWLNSVTTNSGTGLDTLPAGLSYFAKFNETWDVVLQAAAGDNRVRVIQRPSIQTSHATPASLFIGSTVPYVTSTYFGSGYGGGPSASYQQLRVGIGLNVTPFINQEGLVVMKIDETIDELDGSTPIVGVGDVPNTKSSSLSAEIAVRDGESIILGGIIRNAAEKKNSGVPYLRDIPLLGYLFSTTSSNKKRQEAIVLMRPTVLRTPELAAQLVKDKRKTLPGISRAAAENERDERAAMEREQRLLERESENANRPRENKLFKTPDELAP